MIGLKSNKHRVRAASPNPRARKIRLGVGLYLVLALVFGLLWAKPQMRTFLASGDVIVAEFSTASKLRANDSSVKMAGLQVGRVSGISETDHGTVRVTMKVDKSVVDRLGSEPSARIEPRTVLGGRYVVELHQGGEPGRFNGKTIPQSRSAETVEVDSILEALPTSARESLQSLVGSAGDTLHASDRQLRDTLSKAPGVLKPGGEVLAAVEGTRPGRDLPELVTNLSAVARTLTARDGQLDSIVTSLYETSAVLATHRAPLASTVHTLPGTLRDARAGMDGLRGSVDELTVTARALRPTAGEARRLLVRLDPMLRQARPLLQDLRPALADARPAVERLVPVAQQATGVLDDLHGPVLDRVNGPVMEFLLNPWHGTGAYKDSGYGFQEDHKFYEELAYMVTNVDRASSTQDQHGSSFSFQVGAGLKSLALDGLPFSLDNLLKLARKQAGGAR